MVIRQGEKDPFIRNVFTLKTCAPIIGSQVLSFQVEKDMLKVYSLLLCILIKFGSDLLKHIFFFSISNLPLKIMLTICKIVVNKITSILYLKCCEI